MIYSGAFDDADVFVEATDQMNYNASWGLLLVIGEESKKLSKELRTEYPSVPWKSISATRNFIAHEYRTLNQQLIFDIIKQDLPPLKSAIISMFNKVDYEEEALTSALSSPYYQHIQYLRDKLHD